MDFTLFTYKALLENLHQNYTFLPFSTFIQSTNPAINKSLIILRHDVDRLPENSLRTAQIENSLGIKGSYYFRVVPESYNLEIMEQIAKLGHEIGYHYEDVDLVLQRHPSSFTKRTTPRLKKEELIDLAYESFCKNLEMFRENFDVKTICMHGSPRSKYDNRIIWSKYNYKDLGIIAEPYFDIDFNEFAYFTDTGRRWNGNKFSIRDKVKSKYNFDFKTTQDIIDNIDKLPNKLMFTVHPERWTNRLIPWTKQLVMQNVKNVVKRVVIKTKLIRLRSKNELRRDRSVSV